MNKISTLTITAASLGGCALGIILALLFTTFSAFMSGVSAGEQKVRDEYDMMDVTVGPPDYPNCQYTISLSTLEQLNDMGMWRTITACWEMEQ
jgi:hypothetical protein